LKKGASGAFEVRLDGELIFSKRESGRFPDSGEVEEALAALLK
jgi:selT/selW/selH-like putative selenoprotein